MLNKNESNEDISLWLFVTASQRELTKRRYINIQMKECRNAFEKNLPSSWDVYFVPKNHKASVCSFFTLLKDAKPRDETNWRYYFQKWKTSFTPGQQWKLNLKRVFLQV